MQWNKDIFPITKQIYGFLLLFVTFLYLKSVANLFYGLVKPFLSARGFWHSVLTMNTCARLIYFSQPVVLKVLLAAFVQ